MSNDHRSLVPEAARFVPGDLVVVEFHSTYVDWLFNKEEAAVVVRDLGESTIQVKLEVGWRVMYVRREDVELRARRKPSEEPCLLTEPDLRALRSLRDAVAGAAAPARALDRVLAMYETVPEVRHGR